MLPNTTKATPVPGNILMPDSNNAVPLLEDFETGGVALSDTSQGFLVQDWKAAVRFGEPQLVIDSGSGGSTARFDTPSDIYLTPLNTPDQEVLVHSATSVSEITFSFDQNMRQVIAYVEGGDNPGTKIYYFDSAAASFIVKEVPDAVSPFLSLDDKRITGTFLGISDVLLFYLKGTSLHYRMQRDSYDVEYTLATDLPGRVERIVKCGLNNQYRMQIEIALRNDTNAA